MILVDTSVWINYFNGVDSLHTRLLDAALLDDVVAMGDLILLEILQGFTSDSSYNLATQKLSRLDQHEMLGNHNVDKCAENYRSLRKRGITIRKTADVIIATYCIDQKIPLLFTDRDFEPFVHHLRLESVAESDI